ncbi:hypothetical protein [Streptomyces sp. NPDC090025]|uniref:hypothetical protein n=1 Tax=Streptomyces sp. NPDC090025 TaxID=3365922 RepID=UPI0038350562
MTTLPPAAPAASPAPPELSSYLRHLPPVLWERAPEPSGFSLGAALRIFEKILTGIADDVAVPHGDHTHPAIADRIASLELLFDPWRTPEEFLPWLASWVALEFPTLDGQHLWDAYQRRKVTSEIARTYGMRGLRGGLNTLLDLYTVGSTRPRIALDDGSRVLTLTPGTTERGSQVTALVTQGPVLAPGDRLWAEGLMRPTCVAAAGDGSLFLGDAGTPDGVTPVLPSRVWHLDANGGYAMTGAPPRPTPLALAAGATALTRVVAVAVSPAHDGRPETLYALDRSGRLYTADAPYTAPLTQLGTIGTSGTALYPVAMAVDTNGDLLVLDRGVPPPSTAAAKVLTVKTAPLSTAPTTLTTVVEPLSLLVRPDGSLLVGDGGKQRPAGPAEFPGNVVTVSRAAGGWTEAPLLPAANPLVAPTALALDRDGTTLYVLDAGLKPLQPSTGSTFTLKVAEPAVVHRIATGAGGRPPVPVPLTVPGSFVCPTGLTATGGRLVISDYGVPDGTGQNTYLPRLQPYRLDVVVHFTDGRLPQDAAQRAKARNQTIGAIHTLVEQNKPAHVLAVLVK